MNRLTKTISRVLATPPKGGARRSSRRAQNLTGRPQRSRRALGGRVRLTRLRRPRTVSNPSWGRSLPAAYASHVRPRFNVMSRTATSARVTGCDLVYPIPNAIETDGANIFAVITSNPAYWTGTRIAQFAPAYMNYRPLSITFSYIPQVAVTQAGTVFMGTVWNGAAPATNVQQTLVTSNGGCLTQCYVPCDTTINLGSNLQQNLFTLSGALEPDSSPFLFLAGVRGTDVVPGYFYVSYTYEFKNPIGQAWNYGRSEVLTGSAIPITSTHPNSSLVLLSQSNEYGPGTIFDLESTGVFYHGTPVEIQPEASVIEFYNQQTIPPTPSPTPQENKVVAIGATNVDPISLADLAYLPSGTPAPSGHRFYVMESGANFSFTQNNTVDTSTNRRWYSSVEAEGTLIRAVFPDQSYISGQVLSITSDLVDTSLLANY